VFLLGKHAIMKHLTLILGTMQCNDSFWNLMNNIQSAEGQQSFMVTV